MFDYLCYCTDVLVINQMKGQAMDSACCTGIVGIDGVVGSAFFPSWTDMVRTDALDHQASLGAAFLAAREPGPLQRLLRRNRTRVRTVTVVPLATVR